MKRRQRVRTITIAVTLIIIAASLVIGFYVALNAGNTGLDKYDGVAVSSTDLGTLYQVSHAAYGPSGSSLLATSGGSTNLAAASGSPYVTNGKPIIVYIGADFCPYCAAERWSLIMGLSRFGNFSNLHYMTSGSGSEGDYATFTFTGSSYSSKYVAFEPIEQEDRDRNVIAAVPTNASSGFGSAYPFVNFNNRYLLTTLIPDTSVLAGKNWTQIFASISSGDSTGTLIKEGANAITALICKVIPSSLQDSKSNAVCNAPAITSTNIGLASPSGDSMSIAQVSAPTYAPAPGTRHRWS
jgi:thiol-disulfide isomerase/thioredoxin